MSLTADQIIDRVARAYDVKRADLLSDWRSPVVAVPRFAAMHMLRTERRLSTQAIARLMRRKDHTTVLNGLRRCEQMLVHDRDFAARYQEARAA